MTSPSNFLELTGGVEKLTGGFNPPTPPTIQSLSTSMSVGNSFATGVDLSEILRGTKYWGKVVIKSWAFLNYWGRIRALPQSLRLCLLPWLSKLHVCLYWDIAKKNIWGLDFWRFSVEFGQILRHFYGQYYGTA